MAKTKVIRMMVLMNNRNFHIKNRMKFNSNVVCFKIRCTYEQFVKGDCHQAALNETKKFIHKRLEDSSENFDLLCYNKYEGHFFMPQAWTSSNWKQSDILDISKNPISKDDE